VKVHASRMAHVIAFQEDKNIW